MAAAFAFFGILLTSLLVAELAVLSLGDFFGADGEFLPVIAGVAAYSALSVLVFAIVYARAERPRALNIAAMLLVLVAMAVVAVPGIVPWIATYSTDPFTVGEETFNIALELLVPSVLAVLVQWGLVRRRHLRVGGEDDLTLWPWISTVAAALIALSPYGLAFIQASLKRSGGDMMWQFVSTVTLGVACGLVVMAGIECYIRARMLRGRRLPSLPVARALV